MVFTCTGTTTRPTVLTTSTGSTTPPLSLRPSRVTSLCSRTTRRLDQPAVKYSIVCTASPFHDFYSVYMYIHMYLCCVLFRVLHVACTAGVQH